MWFVNKNNELQYIESNDGYKYSKERLIELNYPLSELKTWHLDVIKTADWIIDLGPEGGDAGGEIIACGTPEDVAKNEKSYTGFYLRKVLQS